MFSVLTLNLRFGLAEDGPNSWAYRKKLFSSLFKRYRTDFISLQEANDFQIDFMANILPEYGYIGKRTPAPAFWQNNIIFYKSSWNCVLREHFYLSPTPMIPSRFRKSRWPRQCTLGVFTRKSRKLICINTHFDFDTSVQNQSAKLIMERLAHLPGYIPAILTGDFNATPSSSCYKIFSPRHQNLSKDGPYFKNAFDKPYPGTQHGFTGNTNGNHIDWILYRGALIIEKSTAIHDHFDSLYPSDHFPLKAVFRWEGEDDQ